MDDASLEEFTDADGGSEGTGQDGAGGAETDGTTPAVDDGDAGSDEADAPTVDPDAVEPASTTFAWSADPVACEDCGAGVQRRWRDGGRLVCPDCKEW